MIDGNTLGYRFGPFEVDLRAGELRKRGLRIALQRQPFCVLEALIECPQSVVSREALRRRLWPDGTFVDFEHSLNAAVRRLRVALGDDGDAPRFIETLHRRGYRLLCSVEEIRAGHGARPDRLRNSRRRRLAVLPFAPVALETPPDTFSDGLTEETITQLARHSPSGIGIIARTSVSSTMRDGRSASEIGRALGADYLVEGGIRREGERVRITAQLIETEEETHLWAETYERSVADCLTVQTEIADHIARAVTATLLEGEASGPPPAAARSGASSGRPAEPGAKTSAPANGRFRQTTLSWRGAG